LGLQFYLSKRYNTAIHVWGNTKSLTPLGQLSVSLESHISIRDMLSKTNTRNREYGFINIFQKIKLTTTKMIALFTEEDNPFITDELLQLGPGDKYLFVTREYCCII
jgi:hypothetical protein